MPSHPPPQQASSSIPNPSSYAVGDRYSLPPAAPSHPPHAYAGDPRAPPAGSSTSGMSTGGVGSNAYGSTPYGGIGVGVGSGAVGLASGPAGGSSYGVRDARAAAGAHLPPTHAPGVEVGGGAYGGSGREVGRYGSGLGLVVGASGAASGASQLSLRETYAREYQSAPYVPSGGSSVPPRAGEPAPLVASSSPYSSYSGSSSSAYYRGGGSADTGMINTNALGSFAAKATPSASAAPSSSLRPGSVPERSYNDLAYSPRDYSNPYAPGGSRDTVGGNSDMAAGVGPSAYGGVGRTGNLGGASAYGSGAGAGAGAGAGYAGGYSSSGPGVSYGGGVGGGGSQSYPNERGYGGSAPPSGLAASSSIYGGHTGSPSSASYPSSAPSPYASSQYSQPARAPYSAQGLSLSADAQRSLSQLLQPSRGGGAAGGNRNV